MNLIENYNTAFLNKCTSVHTIFACLPISFYLYEMTYQCANVLWYLDSITCRKKNIDNLFIAIAIQLIKF